MKTEDAIQDELYDVYLRARSKQAKALAIVGLMKASEPFIARTVRHWSYGPIASLEPEEAMQQGRIGFLDAVRRADPAKGPLRPYAISRIRHELQNLAEVNFGIKVPRRSGMPAKVLREIEILYTKEGREPTPAELNGHAGEYLEAQTRPRVVASFDAVVTEGHGLSDLIPHEAPSALDALIEQEERSRASPAMAAVIEAALTRPVMPTPRKKKIPMPVPEKPNPIAQLAEAIDGVKSYLGTLDEQEAAIKKEREEIRATLGKLTLNGHTNGHTNGAGRPMIHLNQDKPIHKIVGFLKTNPNVKVAVIAAGIGETTKDTALALAKLRVSNVVETQGKARGTTYALIPR